MKIIKELQNITFIEKSVKKFGKNILDYSKLQYINQYEHVVLICKNHNIEFSQTPKHHLRGKTTGCPKCQIESNNLSVQKRERKLFFHKFKKHIDYSKINFDEYVNLNTVGNFICKIHNISYNQKFRDHFNSNNKGGCPNCKKEKKISVTKYTNEEFIEASIKKFKNKFSYSKTNYIYSLNKVIITCKKHGDFSIVAAEHLSGCGGCNKCNTSLGELLIQNYLDNKSIDYEMQKVFIDCINPDTNKKLKFDFYIPEKNIIIEFHGQQHFKSVKWFGGDKEFLKRKNRDLIKENYCNSKNINFHVIKYNDNLLNSLESIFKD